MTSASFSFGLQTRSDSSPLLERPRTGAVIAFNSGNVQTPTGGGIPAYLRQPRGRGIFAACGQLKRTVEA